LQEALLSSRGATIVTSLIVAALAALLAMF
jgi:hypothetical protein